MINYKLNLLNSGEIKTYGYPRVLFDYVNNNQLKNSSTWDLLANQFKIHSDVDNNWRGEYWGKLMRGAALSYRLTADYELYKILTDSVNKILSYQEDDGRLSSYPRDKEFNGWDMWGRKYIMLGLLTYYDICRSSTLKRRIVRCLKKHADYIISHIGRGSNKKDLFETSGLYGCLNSASILEPFVKLYKICGVKRYLNFATYIVKKGFCKNFNIIEKCLTSDTFPYQFPVKKAYEMMSCFEGLIEYYMIVNDDKYLRAVINYADMIHDTDFTIIGCSGCNSEFLDNSSLTQTNYTDKIMQETCVTVTYMNLLLKLFRLTKNAKYVSWMETSIYNALYGSVNNENQTMKNTNGYVWVCDPPLIAKHEAWAFDSYSPLVYSRRGKTVGGFLLLQNDRSYGCCACNGACGTAVSGLLNVLRNEDEYYINLFNKIRVKTNDVSIDINANIYTKNIVTIKLKSHKKVKIFVRIPEWFNQYNILVNGKKENLHVNNGYISFEKQFDNDVVKITYSSPVTVHLLNDKIAFTKGPIVLARDNRLEKIKTPLSVKFKNQQRIRTKTIKNLKFSSNICLSVKTKDGDITLVDYSQAGKNFDDLNSMITVWQDIKKEVSL